MALARRKLQGPRYFLLPQLRFSRWQKKNWKIEYLGECELDEKTSALVDRMTAEADAELDETRICFRWGKEQLEIVKRAANTVGVPYQTFLKLAVYQHAIEVLKNATVATPKDAA